MKSVKNHIVDQIESTTRWHTKHGAWGDAVDVPLRTIKHVIEDGGIEDIKWAVSGQVVLK
tara:strand:- start:16427 stop:16606 length:180 start_codon:yes stop_codon:yes gene_type:complete